MERDIIIINEDKCTGCGICVTGCHEGALKVIDGKVRLIGELLCDGLGACIKGCPTGALKIEKREAEPYDEIKVMEGLVSKGENVIKAHLQHMKDHKQTLYFNQGIQYLKDHNIKVPEGLETAPAFDASAFQGCPGSAARALPKKSGEAVSAAEVPGMLEQWPIQLHLVSPMAPYFKNSHLLLAADCTAFTLGAFHGKLLANRRLAIACPKLDDYEGYIEKLVAFIDHAEIASMTVVTMEVPCCGGLWAMAQEAISRAERKIPVEREIINIDGSLRQ
jgi:NAD-dependent dihydropyrimidine dehydrogenase PreA subunit